MVIILVSKRKGGILVGIVVACHGGLAEGFVDAVTLLTGRQKGLVGIGLMLGKSPIDFGEQIKEAIDSVNEGDGVLVLVDLFGGTPSNSAAQLIDREDIRALAGVNLPMLISAIFERSDASLDDLAEKTMASGALGLIDVRKKLLEAAAEEDDEF